MSSILPEHDAQHRCHHIHSEQIVGISEEANSSYHDSTDVIPPKRSLVDLCKSKSSALIGVCNVGVVIMEVVEGCVAAGSPVDGLIR